MSHRERESGWWSPLWAVSSPGAHTWSPSETNYLHVSKFRMSKSADCKTHRAININTILLKYIHWKTFCMDPWLQKTQIIPNKTPYKEQISYISTYRKVSLEKISCSWTLTLLPQQKTFQIVIKIKTMGCQHGLNVAYIQKLYVELTINVWFSVFCRASDNVF